MVPTTTHNEVRRTERKREGMEGEGTHSEARTSTNIDETDFFPLLYSPNIPCSSSLLHAQTSIHPHSPSLLPVLTTFLCPLSHQNLLGLGSPCLAPYCSPSWPCTSSLYKPTPWFRGKYHLLPPQTADTGRWGAAVTVLSLNPTVVIQGGKIDPSGQYSYSSAPNNADTILLPLSAPFSASSPPYALLSPINPGPSYAWHCLAPLFVRDGEWTLLSFGGDGGWPTPISDSHSAWLVSLNPTTGFLNYTNPPSGWANQPSRRVRHACAAPLSGGKVYITGGQEPDYSEAFAQSFVFDPTTQLFGPLPALPAALYGHSSVLLTNGTLLVFGGTAARSGASAIQPMNTLYVLDTTASGAWATLSVGGAYPPARHGASASLNPDGTVFLFGGADGAGKGLNDGWVLVPATLSWTQTFGGSGECLREDALTVDVPGRYDQAGVPAGGGQVIIVGGECLTLR